MDETAPHVLLIDDDPDFRASVTSFLEDQGFCVLGAATGHEGLLLARETRPDLVILDVMMESSTEGYVVNQALKFCAEYEGCRDTPVIMVSSIEASPDELYPRAEEVGMIQPNVYLTKPLDFTHFLDVVTRLTRHPART